MKALNEIDFLALAKKEKKARKRSRLLALAHFKEGKCRLQTGQYLSFAPSARLFMDIQPIQTP
jgi:hypothetical protein